MVAEEKGKGKDVPDTHFQVSCCQFAVGQFIFLKKLLQKYLNTMLSFLTGCFYVSCNLFCRYMSFSLQMTWQKGDMRIPSGNVAAQFLHVFDSWHPKSEGCVERASSSTLYTHIYAHTHTHTNTRIHALTLKAVLTSLDNLDWI